MSNQKIAELQLEIYNLTVKLNDLLKNAERREVAGYSFATLEGEVTLLELFGDRQHLLVIHNMGQACRYCTLWGDGINGVLAHLEDAMSVVLVSKDPPKDQRNFANSRNWRFRLASHGGGKYISEQTVMEGQANMPGAVLYERLEKQVFRRHGAIFGPGDLYCPAWHLLALAGRGADDWTPQFRYWLPPKQMEDGGADMLE